MKANKKWPDWYPEGCPPEGYTPRELFVYRCAETKPHSNKDFVPHYQREEKDWGKKLFDSCGLSCFTEWKDVVDLKNKLPKFKCIISGTILKEMGVVAETPSKRRPSHVTWWVYEGVEAHRLFTVCEEGDENE